MWRAHATWDGIRWTGETPHCEGWRRRRDTNGDGSYEEDPARAKNVDIESRYVMFLLSSDMT